MSAIHSKSALVYAQVRRALQSGRYLPGQRIDPASLAAEFRTSPTPVRFALYRLVGAGLLADHARNGLHVPLPTEVALRDLYDWMQRLLLMACDIGVAATAARPQEVLPECGGADVVKMTWQLFDTIAGTTGHRCLHHAVRRANDRLAPIRHAKQYLLENAGEELLELRRHWRERDMAALGAAVRGYHERRLQHVPRIVAMLNDGRDSIR
ncbi:GntR family transcriptional regulator [Xanthomonas campestris pv. phormiicola]|nr:GntR family transcriptional regulator [Xanthomonas campestris pv. phormiicola]UYC15963.1 GntR family transcriptional regulator [Xanthomonas campestris pv. phormiicola]